MSTWSTSNRRSELPPNWEALRRQVMDRDGRRCTFGTASGNRCPEDATDVDHIRPGSDHSLTNLRALCRWHHQRKSSSEGFAARYKRQQEIRQRFRRTEAHPGLL